MGTITDQEGKARFETRLSKDKKLMIEKTALWGGYKNLSDFVVTTVCGKAQAIIQKS